MAIRVTQWQYKSCTFSSPSAPDNELLEKSLCSIQLYTQHLLQSSGYWSINIHWIRKSMGLTKSRVPFDNFQVNNTMQPISRDKSPRYNLASKNIHASTWKETSFQTIINVPPSLTCTLGSKWTEGARGNYGVVLDKMLEFKWDSASLVTDSQPLSQTSFSSEIEGRAAAGNTKIIRERIQRSFFLPEENYEMQSWLFIM